MALTVALKAAVAKRDAARHVPSPNTAEVAAAQREVDRIAGAIARRRRTARLLKGA